MDADVAASCTTVADRFLCGEIPNATLKAKLSLCQGSHRADVNHISRVGIVQSLLRREIDDRAVAAIENTQFVAFGDFLTKPCAACTQDAPFLIENDVGSDGKSLFSLDLVFQEAAVVLAKFHVVILKVTLSGLVAHGAVQGMIDQQKFQHGFAGLLDFFRIGGDLHAVLGLRIAGDGQLGHSLDLNQTYPAAAGDGESRVIAITGNGDAQILGCLDHG